MSILGELGETLAGQAINPKLLNVLRVFGSGLVKSGILKPASTAAREVGEMSGLIGSRQTMRAVSPSQLPEVVRGLVGKVQPSSLRPEFQNIVEAAAQKTAASMPKTAAPGIRGLSPLITNRTPVQGPRVPPLQGPNPVEGFRVPLQGEQLDMFSGFNRLTNPKGAVTAEGTKIGGVTFNPADVMPEGVYTQRIRELARSKGIPEELFIEQMRRPGASLSEAVDFASIPSQTGLFAKPAEFGMYQARNLIKNNMTNLVELVRNNPRLAAGLGIAIGGAGTAYGISEFIGGDAGAPEIPLRTPMGPTTESADVGGLINDPQAVKNRQTNIAQQIAESMTPSARANIPTPTYRGAEGQTVITTRGEDEALRAAKQQYTKPQAQLREYYAQRERYAGFPANKAEIVSELTKRGVLDSPQLVAWASSNPELAYELLRKATGSNTLPSQQLPQQTQKVITAPAGSNNANNIIGNTSAASQAAVDGTQGASDLRSFTTPQITDEVRGLDPALIYALQGRNLI